MGRTFPNDRPLIVQPPLIDFRYANVLLIDLQSADLLFVDHFPMTGLKSILLTGLQSDNPVLTNIQ